uniref:Uncharacterized protein n=1 Tax=Anopheles atroparvus TaxID=41427 RepID=A0A182J010_ANOAO
MVAGNLGELEQSVSLQSLSADGGSPIALLSRAYAELKHRNVPLSAEVVHFIEYELIKASYRNAAYHQGAESNATAKNEELSARVADMVQCIELIERHHQTGLYTDIDELFIHRLRQIYAHVFFLKTHHRKLPLLQVQFCIGVFLKLVTGKPVNGFDIYAFTIDKVRLIRFLKSIGDELKNPPAAILSLEQYIQCVRQSIKSPPRKSMRRVTKRVRSFIWNDIRTDEFILKDGSNALETPFDKLPPQLQTRLKAHYEKTIEWDRRRRSKRVFKELNETYYTMKQHYSILKILTYIDGMQGGSVPDSPIVLRPVPSPTRIRAIKRTVQVIGEMIKSTRETPNITVKLNRVLQLITSDVLMEHTKDLRQFFSHGYPLSKWELERDDRGQPEKLAAVFQKIETNLREARRWFVYTQTQQNVRIYRQYLGHLRGFTSTDALRDYIGFVGTEFKASLIQSFLPEQLTEAKLLIEYLLRDYAGPSSDSAGASVCDELEYILRELQLRIVAIRAENNSLGRSVDEFFFLEKYARQSTVRLQRVREIVDWILARTELSNRHKLVQKTDLMYARELIVQLQMDEQDDTRRYLWGNVWERLAKESFKGIDALLGRTETRVNVALEETARTLQALGLPLEMEEYVQFANRRLAKSYYPNVFVLDNKYRVLKELVKDRRAQVNTRSAQEKLKETRKADELLLQQMFDELLDSMEELLNRSVEKSTDSLPSSTDQIALEYCLLEVAEILCNVGLFRDNMADLSVAVVPVVTGRNLRNYLAHDFLAYDTLTNSSRTVVLNARYLVEHRFKLYNPAASSRTVPSGNVEMMRCNFQEIFKQQTEWTEQQVDFFRMIKHFDTPSLHQIVAQAEEEDGSANLLLLRRNFLDQDIISIALDADPARFIEQTLGYEESSDNFFHLLILFFKCDQLTEKVKLMIQHPHTFCFRVALKHGLLDVIRSVYQQSDERVMQQIIDSDLSAVINRLPTDSVRELMNLLPPEWFLGAGDHLGNTILHWSTLRGDEDLLRFVLGRHWTLINIANKFGDVPLLLATRYHDDAIAQLLLDWGADPCVSVNIVKTIAIRDSRDLLGRLRNQWKRFHYAELSERPLNNPLRDALEGNHFEMFVMLHQSFRYSVKCGELLHLAARLDRVDFLNYMLTVWEDELQGDKAYIDPVNADYCITPLMLACATGHYECAQVLLKHGADGLFRNENNYCPWHFAVHSGKKNILSLLMPLPGLDVNLLTRDKRSALTIAIENDQSTAQIDYLLRAGVTIRADDVLRACLLEQLDTLKLFIDRRPELLSARDFLQRTPLIIAVVVRNEAMIQYLLDRGASIDAANTQGMNSLHVAVLNNLTPICRKLLDANANVNAEDTCGRTPLVIALENELLGAAEMLLQCGARVESAYQFRYTLHRNATLLHKFTIENRPWMVEYLINKLNFPTNIVDEDGKTASMYKNES